MSFFALAARLAFFAQILKETVLAAGAADTSADTGAGADAATSGGGGVDLIMVLSVRLSFNNGNRCGGGILIADAKINKYAFMTEILNCKLFL